MLHADRIIDGLPEEIYNKAPNSRIKILLSSLLQSVNAAELRFIQTYLDMFLKTSRFEALDYNFGMLFKMPRLPSEKYIYRPLVDTLTPEQWSEIDSKDGKYRNRLLKFVEAATTGGVAGIKMACEAATGYSCHIQEKYHIGTGIKDPTGLREFVIIPFKPAYDLEDELRIKLVVDRIKPVTTFYEIAPTVETIEEIVLHDISASSQYQQVNVEKDFFTRIAEYDTEDVVTNLAGVSSELIQEEVYRKPGQYVVKPTYIDSVEASGSPNVTRNVSFHSSSVDCWYGYNGDVHGHRGTDAVDGNTGTYWLSVGNGSPTDVYAYEWIQVQINESEEGRGFNKIRFYTPYANMSMWISVMGIDNQWWNFGGSPIPYDPSHSAAYPNGSNIYWAFYVADTGAAGWHEYNWGFWFPNAKYVRLTFHNLANSGIGPYVYRAAVSEIQVVADLVDYYSAQRAIQYDNDITWISQTDDYENTSGRVWFKTKFNGRQTVNRLKIVRGNRAPDQEIYVYDDANQLIKVASLRSVVTIIAFDDVSTSYLLLNWSKANRMSILSGKYGAEINNIEVWSEVYQEGEAVITYKKPHPAKNVCDGNPSTWWSSAQHKGPGDAMEYVEVYLIVDSEINRIQVWTNSKGMNVAAKYWDKSKNQWRYCASKADCDYVTILEFDMVETSALRLEFTQLARQGNKMYAAVVREITAWARLDESETYETFTKIPIYKWGAEKAIDGDINTFWRSSGSPDTQSIEWLNMTVPASAGAISGIYIDPETPGCTVNIYSSDDNQYWKPVHHDYYLDNEIMWLPEPIKASYIKLEFSKLQPRGYIYSIKEVYETQRYDLTEAEQQRLGGLQYTRFLEKGEHTYSTKEITATRPVANYVGVKEVKLFKKIGLGIDWHNFCDYLQDDSYINYSACPSGSNNLYLTNETMATSAGEIDNFLQMQTFDMVHDLKSIGLNIDQYVPSGGNAIWEVSRNDGVDWHDISDLLEIITVDNVYFVFPDSDAAPWDKFVMRCTITNYNAEEVYVLNDYCIEFYYYILL